MNQIAIFKAFESYNVLILPGFIGCSKTSQITLLGRGGLDLSAIFVASSLKIKECILYKNSGGIVEDITIESSKQKRYSQITYDECSKISYPVIQHKALNHVKNH